MTTIMRLSLWGPPESMARFQYACINQIAPLLQKHGLAEYTREESTAPQGVFNLFFTVATPADVLAIEQALQQNAAWQEALQRLGTEFGVFAADGRTRHHFGVYRTPADPGVKKAARGQAHKAGAVLKVEAGMGIRRGAWQNFDITDGFPSGGVLAILQHRQGDLWFGIWGESRICRYDGMEFVTFANPPGRIVYALCQDRAGNMWLGTDEGACRYDGAQFTTFSTADGLADNRIRAILEDRAGKLWFATTSGVSYYEDGAFITLPQTSTVYALCQDRAGNMWLGTDEGACRYDGAQFTTFSTADGLADNRVRAILEDRAGQLWFATTDGVSRRDDEGFTSYAVADGLVHNSVLSICQDREGQLWFGTNEGVSRCDEQGRFTAVDDLENAMVSAIYEDGEGSLWFGTGGGESMGSGVVRYDGAHLRTFTTRDGLVNNHAVGVLEDRAGNVWFGTWRGVSRWDGERFHTLEGLKANVRAICEDRAGNLWFATYYNGVIRYDGRQFTAFTSADGLADDTVETLLEDRQGQLWLGTDRGVSRSAGPQRTATDPRFAIFPLDAGPAREVRSIFADRHGNLWIGITGVGVCRYDGRTLRVFTAADGLPGYGVIAILEDRQGSLWFGLAGGGLCRYDGRNWEAFTTADGLPRQAIMSILEDRQGQLWFCSYGGGICRYDGLVFQTLHQRNGLAHNGVQRVVEDRRGDFWITTESGVTRYRPGRIPPSVRLLRAVADRDYEAVDSLTLQVSQRRIAFEFRGRSLRTGRDQMAYAYRLQGRETAWRWTRQEQVVYSDLAVGDYAFEVKAVDCDLNYSAPARLSIEVVPDYRIEALTQALSQDAGEFVGDSPALSRIQAHLAQVAGTDLTVLITGETGTGKGLAARTTHALSANQAGPFVQVNCGAIPTGLVESELFGHEKGAFTGAVAKKLGKVELAEGGTLFLDEIGDMSLEAQVKLLRLLEERVFERVGGTRTMAANVRVIAATNRDLAHMVKVGSFREDLYYRLQVFPVRLPSLRERREDIALLATYFMVRMAAHLNKEIACLAPDALQALHHYDWPGNVRELEHVIQRAVVVCSERTIQVADLGLESGAVQADTTTQILTLEEMERRYIREVLEKTKGVIKGQQGAATLLWLPPSTLYFRMKKLGIQHK